ncbi:MAG: hypothetical protein KDN22_02825 [Verrucomicrobiae bacterium]|nr:hypothetical protein [Verrucomicrobiae bacterium]
MRTRYIHLCVLVLAAGLGTGAKWTSLRCTAIEHPDAHEDSRLSGPPTLIESLKTSTASPSIESLELLIRDKFELRAELILTDTLKSCPMSHLEKLCRQYAQRKGYAGHSSLLWSSLVQNLASRSVDKAVAIVLEDPDTPIPEAAVLERFQQLVASDPAAAIAQMRTLRPGYLRKLFGIAIIDQLYEESPISALEFAAAEDIDLTIQRLLKKFPESIDQLASAIRGNKQLASLKQDFALAWAEMDAEAALDWALTLKGSDHREIATDILSRIAYEDPLTAFDRMAEMPPAFHQLNLLQDVIPRMLNTSFEATLSRITALHGSKSRWYAITRLAELLRDDPGKAVAVAEALQDDGPLLRHFEKEIMPPLEVTSESLAGTRPGGPGDNLIRELIDNLAEKTRFDEGVAFIESLPGAPENLYGIEQFANQWAHLDPQKAADWASKLEVEGYRKSALTGLVDTWGASDPAKASIFIDGLADDAIGRQMKVQFAGVWAQKQPLEALQWAAEQDNRTLARAATTAAVKTPVEVAGQFSQLFPDAAKLASDTAVAVASAVAENWSRLDPSASLTWSQELPDGRVRDEAESNSILGWAKWDSRAASEAVAQIPEDRRDPAAAGLAQGIASTDPDAAWAWSMAIQDSEWRDRALQNLMWNWRKSDPDRARERIGESALPAEIKENLYQRLK